MIERKTCSKCKMEKRLMKFSNRASSVDRKSPWCKECSHQNLQIWRKTDKGKHSMRQRNLKVKYNVSLEDYQILLENQKNNCAICNEKESAMNHYSKTVKRLAVDHCHTTGKIRGLLCTNCNTLIGKSKDDIDILRNVIKYLESV